jgi:hypothetical protein
MKAARQAGEEFDGAVTPGPAVLPGLQPIAKVLPRRSGDMPRSADSGTARSGAASPLDEPHPKNANPQTMTKVERMLRR